MSTSINEKIKKLLALGTSPNRNEAELALAKAQELMLKFGVDPDALTEKVIRKSIRFWKCNATPKEAIIIGGLAKQYRCVISFNNFSINLHGYPSDLEVAEAAILYIWEAFESNWKSCWKDIKYKKNRNRSKSKLAYCQGYKWGVEEKMEASRIFNSLVLITPPEVTDQTAKLTTRNMKVNMNLGTLIHGYVAGKKLFSHKRIEAK